MLKIRAINRKLVERVQLCLHGIPRRPDIITITFENKHSMVHSRTLEITQHILLRRRLFVVFISGIDDIPFAIKLPNFWCPVAVREGSILWRCEDKFYIGAVPVSVAVSVKAMSIVQRDTRQNGASKHGDIVVSSVGHVVIAIMTDDEPSQSARTMLWVWISQYLRISSYFIQYRICIRSNRSTRCCSMRPNRV